VTLKRPAPLTETVGGPTAELSQVSWTRVPAGKPVPVMVTEAPAGPTDGESEIAGADVDAKVDVNGRRRAAATMTIVAVAAKSRQRELRRVCVGVTSETHRVPSQKANAVLHSATRLTRGVPWLCGPASRRVCLFVAARLSRCLWVRGHVDRLAAEPYAVVSAVPITRSFAAAGTEVPARRREPKYRGFRPTSDVGPAGVLCC
jgi:hypothetical protein